MNADIHAVSKCLQEIGAQIQSDVNSGRVPSAAELAEIAAYLRTAGGLAQLMEHELAVFRLREDNRHRRGAMEGAASDALTDALLTRDGNIVQPNFGRGR